jgi:hypothetical protein
VALVLACAEHAGIILTKRDSTEARESYLLPNPSTHYSLCLYFSSADVIGLDCPSPIDKLSSRSSDESDSRARSNTSPEAPISNPSKEERVVILAINEFDSHRSVYFPSSSFVVLTPLCSQKAHVSRGEDRKWLTTSALQRSRLFHVSFLHHRSIHHTGVPLSPLLLPLPLPLTSSHLSLRLPVQGTHR